MVVQSRYTAGNALLLGAGDRWLLLTDPADDEAVAELWALLSAEHPAPGLAERVLTVVERAFADTAFDLVLLELSSGSPSLTTRGAGRTEAVENEAEGRAHLLMLGEQPGHATDRPFLGGVVAAAAAEVAVATPAPGSAALIDGIPDEILAAKGPDGPPPRRPVARGPAQSAPEPVEPEENTADPIEGTTVIRSPHLLAAQPVEQVPAACCPRGHLTPPEEPQCRVCRAQVAPQEIHEVPRPVLGGLRLPTGEVVPLDRGVVLGRRPQAPPTAADWPHLVVVPAQHTFVSRTHLHLWPAGWQVLALDLGSRGGTVRQHADGRTEPLLPGVPQPLEPGDCLALADYRVRFEVDPGPPPRTDEP